MSNDFDTSPPTIRVDQVDSGTSYIGLAQPGADESKAVWQIKKVTTISGSTSILFANGKDHFLNVWDDRASLSYF